VAEGATPVDRLLDLLERHGDKSLDDLCTAIEKAFKHGPRSKRPALQAANAQVHAHTMALKAAEHSDEAFASVLDRIRTDSSIRVADVKAIANGYRNARSNYRSKADALSAVEKTRLSKRRDAVKVKRVRELF
jgi:hypothetical protein